MERRPDGSQAAIDALAHGHEQVACPIKNVDIAATFNSAMRTRASFERSKADKAGVYRWVPQEASRNAS
jgi:hypothetical protein